MRIKISLVELGKKESFTIEKLKTWFPKNKFDKRYPHDCIRKWLHTNSKYLEFLGVSYRWNEDNKKLILTPNNKIGLAPLKNPYGEQVYGSIVVKPKLGWLREWLKIYEILDLIDWRYQPVFLKDEEPIIGDGILPRWFKAIETLEAIFQALDLFMKGISRKRISSSVPIGSVNWDEYAIQSVPYGKYNYFSTAINDYSYDLEIHRQFKGITMIISENVSSPKVPIKIQNEAKMLINNIEKKLKYVNYDTPSIEKLKKIKIPSFYRKYYEKAVQKSIEYLRESKFSIDTSNFYGLPWAVEMNRLFEYWVEYWASKFAKRIGAKFLSDIRHNSKIRFYNLRNWKSMNHLKPDVIIEKDTKTLIIEVKYKKHLEYLRSKCCYSEILEEHRHDIHQLLAYMSASQSKNRIGCMIYPQVEEGKKVQNCQIADLINYTNLRANVKVILCDLPFQREGSLKLFEYIWSDGWMSSSNE